MGLSGAKQACLARCRPSTPRQWQGRLPCREMCPNSKLTAFCVKPSGRGGLCGHWCSVIYALNDGWWKRLLPVEGIRKSRCWGAGRLGKQKTGQGGAGSRVGERVGFGTGHVRAAWGAGSASRVHARVMGPERLRLCGRLVRIGKAVHRGEVAWAGSCRWVGCGQGFYMCVTLGWIGLTKI